MVILVVLPVMALGSYAMGDVVDPYDEGLHMLSGALYRAGRVPYVDFYPLFPPIWTYAQILVEAVFGPLLLVQRFWFVAQGCAVVVVCYMLLRRVVSLRPISLFTITMVVIIGFDPFWIPRWSGVRVAVYMLFWLLYRYHAGGPDEGRGRRLFFLGFFAGLSNLYALDVGIHLTVAGVFMLVVGLLSAVRQGEGYRDASRDLIRCAAGFFLPLLIWGAYLAANGALVSYIVTYYYYYIVLLMPISTKMLSGGGLALTNRKVICLLIFAAFLAAAGLYLLLTGLFRDGGRVRTVPLLAVALSFIASVSAIRAVGGPQYQMFVFIPMLLWMGYWADRAVGALHRLRFFSSGSRADTAKITVAGTLIVLLPFTVPYSFYNGNPKVRLRAFRSNLNLYRLASAGNVCPSGVFSTAPALFGTSDTGFDAMAAYLNSRTRADEAVLAFPMYTEMIPALAGRHSATRYPAPILVMGSPQGQRAYIEDIEREKPRYMVFFPDAKLGGKAPLEPYFKPVYGYLLAHYRPAPDFPNGKDQQIWVRMD